MTDGFLHRFYREERRLASSDAWGSIDTVLPEKVAADASAVPEILELLKALHEKLLRQRRGAKREGQ